MPRRRQPAISSAELDELIEEATVDFQAMVLGVPVTVARVDVTTDDQIVAICACDGHRQTIPILELPVSHPAPDGWEWVEAYRRWAP